MGLSTGALLGNLEGGSFNRGFERERWRRAPLLGTPKDMLSKALEMGVFFHRGPNVGNVEEMLLS